MVDTTILFISICVIIFLVSFIIFFCKLCYNISTRNDILLGVDNQGNPIIIQRINTQNELTTEYVLRNYFDGNQEKIYKMIKNDAPDKTCIICLEPIGENECRLNCGHGYHYQCIREWAYVERKNNCPQCRCIIVEVEV
jgi:hypothetical protein